MKFVKIIQRYSSLILLFCLVLIGFCYIDLIENNKKLIKLVKKEEVLLKRALKNQTEITDTNKDLLDSLNKYKYESK